jgi:hypothetical protein
MIYGRGSLRWPHARQTKEFSHGCFLSIVLSLLFGTAELIQRLVSYEGYEGFH